MVQTQWQQTLSGKSASQGRFAESPILITGMPWTRPVFHRFQLGYRWRLPGPSSVFIVYSGGCWRTPMILAFMQKKSMGEQGTRKQCLELYWVALYQLS